MKDLVIGVIATCIGAVLNFFAVLIYNFITGKSINFLWKNKYKPISEYKSRINYNDLKRITRILVIDDDPIFPIVLFRDAGYNFEKWESVKDFTKLESGFYDIIILDIIGVATQISKDDGLGVLESIKRTNPAQIIVAYSGHSFDLSKQKFWDLADEKLAKPLDFLKTKEIIDNLLLNIFNPQRYFRQLRTLLEKNHIPQKEINQIESKILSCIGKDKFAEPNDIFKTIIENKTLLAQSSNLYNTIQKFY